MEILVIIARTVRLGNDMDGIIAGVLGFIALGIAWFITMQIRAKKIEQGEEPKGSGCGMMFLIWIPLGIIVALISTALRG